MACYHPSVQRAPLQIITTYNKKVLLRERKRHTARRVASARYAALCNGGVDMGSPPDIGYPPEMGYPWTWGTPPDLRWSTPPYPDLRWGTPPRNVNRQTPVKTVPSCHTTYAGGNYRIRFCWVLTDIQTEGSVKRTSCKLCWLIHKHRDLSRGWGSVPEMATVANYGWVSVPVLVQCELSTLYKCSHRDIPRNRDPYPYRLRVCERPSCL